MPDSLLTEIEIAKHLHVSVACVRRWRLERRGPRFLKIGALVRYRREDVEDWINARPAGGPRCTRGGASRVVGRQSLMRCSGRTSWPYINKKNRKTGGTNSTGTAR